MLADNAIGGHLRPRFLESCAFSERRLRAMAPNVSGTKLQMASVRSEWRAAHTPAAATCLGHLSRPARLTRSGQYRFGPERLWAATASG